MLSGGKRLRPAFTHWGYVGAGGGTDDQIDVDAGAAFELMHAFALFHDDVMDDAVTRRGQPTTHTVAAEQHAADGWVGESRRFGEGVAILVGDLAFVYADRLMEGAPPEAMRIWNELRVELNIGQYLDILGSVQSIRDVDKAERICRYKSGKYTIERPLHLGAVLAAPERERRTAPGAQRLRPAARRRLPDARRRDGRVRRGEPDRQVGRRRPARGQADAAAGPRRPPCDSRAARRARRRRRTGPRRPRRRRIQQVIVDTGALAELEDHITALTEAAVAAIEEAPIVDAAKTELVALAEYVSWRDV